MGQVMRRLAAEKQELTHLVGHSALPVGRTLDELDVPRSSFYRWYQQYQRDGEKGLPPPSKRRRFWNRLPKPVREQIAQLALAQPEESAQQLAWLFTGQAG
ncbi:MAG: helix-turn-helix domain-containing protein, partial [Chloroflexi bacterium]|nr:helix-turn-helix domain-containing protein [Chloroflexota bacterium]